MQESAVFLVGDQANGVDTQATLHTSSNVESFDVDLHLNSIPCVMGCPASFTTREMQFQHYVQLKCPKGLDPRAQMLIPAPDIPFKPLFPIVDDDEPPSFDILRHTPDDAPNPPPKRISKHMSSVEISTVVADKTRSFCVTNSYDPSLYTEDPVGYVAVIDDLAGRNIDAYTFPGSSQLIVDEPYKAEFQKYGKFPLFRRGINGQQDIESQKQTATDIAERVDFPQYHDAMIAGGIALFKCPVPGCKADFGPVVELYRFYTHLEDALHWAYFDTHGPIICEFGCGRAFVNPMAFSRHIHSRRCTAIPPPPEPSSTNQI
jgi:hypothetical protein